MVMSKCSRFFALVDLPSFEWHFAHHLSKTGLAFSYARVSTASRSAFTFAGSGGAGGTGSGGLTGLTGSTGSPVTGA
jgi:hypothetical protein